MALLIEQFTTDMEDEGVYVAILCERFDETCLVTVLQDWLGNAEIFAGLLFRKVNGAARSSDPPEFERSASNPADASRTSPD